MGYCVDGSFQMFQAYLSWKKYIYPDKLTVFNIIKIPFYQVETAMSILSFSQGL